MNGAGTTRNPHKEPAIATYSKTQRCTACHMSRSHTQFAPGSDKCKQCVRREVAP